jgi:hypothetical protein
LRTPPRWQSTPQVPVGEQRHLDTLAAAHLATERARPVVVRAALLARGKPLQLTVDDRFGVENRRVVVVVVIVVVEMKGGEMEKMNEKQNEGKKNRTKNRSPTPLARRSTLGVGRHHGGAAADAVR